MPEAPDVAKCDRVKTRIVVTGAGSFVASLLVPRLVARGAELLLVSRKPATLARLFPAIPACSYHELPIRGRGFDTLVHLAARNNDLDGDLDQFREINVAFLESTYRAAAAAGVATFVDISTIHALDEGNFAPYAVSKREGTALLAQIPGPIVRSLHLAMVYGERWSGRLAWLNTLPSRIVKPVFMMFAALKPTVHVDRLVDQLLADDSAPEIVLTDGQANNPFYHGVTRAINFVTGVFILLGLSWLLVGLWLAIRLTSPGPGLFSQQRLGWQGDPFICYKFRTMAVGTRHAGTHEVSASAITPLGRFLRASKLDELPQAWNLIKNDMHLIGPRPGLPVQVELAEARKRHGVLELKPGISGLAQVNNIDMSDPERLAIWDARYGALQSLVLDFKLLLATATGAGRGDPAQKRA